jgi:hypothetical protein
MPERRFAPSPALIIACAALTVALGGTSIAAVSAMLPRNSVGTAQLRNGSVTSIKVANGSLKSVDLAAGVLPTPTPAGPTEFPASLPSGKTLKGTFAGREFAPGAGQDLQIPITFTFGLEAAPTTHYIPSGATPPAACPGTPEDPAAAPGHLCVYESAPALNATGHVFDPISGALDTASRWGAGVSATAAGAGDFRVRGSWAVTAP